MKAIVITFDRLAVHFLGCYGNRWIETPHFDRLAGMSVLFDQHLAENVDPAASRHAWTTGCYTFAPPAAAPRDPSSIIRLLKHRGVMTTLIRERGAGEPHGAREDFELARECTGEEGLDAPPKQASPAAVVDDALPAIEELSQSKKPGLLWVHLRGVPVPWLAPRGYATLYLDLVEEENGEQEAAGNEPDGSDLWDDEELEGGEEAEEETEGEVRLLDFSPEEFDRFLTERASFPQAKEGRDEWSAADRRIMRMLYAGYVTFLDRELGRLLDAIEGSFSDDAPLVIVSAARGEQLDDATALDGPSAMLCDEVVHAPLFVRTQEIKDEIGSRRPALVQTVDLAPTLAEWFGLDGAAASFEGKSLLPLVRNQSLSVRPAAFMGDDARVRGIRTSEAYLVLPSEHRKTELAAPVDTAAKPEAFPPANGGQSPPYGSLAHAKELEGARLFLKPEDIWEVNDIAGQSPDLVESLARELDAFVKRE